MFGWEDTSLELIMPSARFGNDQERIENIGQIIEMGFGDKILIAQDVCQKWQYQRYGGKGFAHILDNIIHRFKSSGFSDSDINNLLVNNPKTAFAF